MNFAATQNTASQYPVNYIRSIHETYHEHDAVLKDLAQVTPGEDAAASQETDLMEHQLLQGQNKLLELVATMRPSSFKDISDILKFWHDVAIKSVAPHDVRLTDELVLVVQNYITENA